MKTIEVKTGFGYYKDGQGHIVAKAELPTGKHPLKNGYEYIEVDTKDELDLIDVWQDPVELEKQKNENKIANKIRKDTIAALIASGELPEGYK